MAETELFQTPCWSFIGGDRQIERLLRELPGGQRVVVRNRVANVLPTIASLADLARGARPLQLAVAAPENAVDMRAVDALPPVAAERLFETLLPVLWGIRVDAAPAADEETVVVAVGFAEGRDGAPALARWLDGRPGAKVVLLLAPGERLDAALRVHAATAWSMQTWDGLCALSAPGVEEAIDEAGPARIVVAAVSEVTAAYTAVGAADLLMRRGFSGDPRRIGEAVTVWRGPAGAAGPARPVGELVREHMAALGAQTAADSRFRATGEAIAIDIP